MYSAEANIQFLVGKLLNGLRELFRGVIPSG
jgi:hypothetical protein